VIEVHTHHCRPRHDGRNDLAGMPSPVCVSFDVYTALVDSRRGGTAAFAELVRRNAWKVDPGELFVGWDARNKLLQAETKPFVTYKELARRALVGGLHGARARR
jgi:hypothetical protein